jgi:hypothetical protein
VTICRIEESEVCYDNFDITSRALREKSNGGSIVWMARTLVAKLQDGAGFLAFGGHDHE